MESKLTSNAAKYLNYRKVWKLLFEMKSIHLTMVLMLIFILCNIPLTAYSQQNGDTDSDLQIANSIIASLSAIGGALAGGLFTYFATVKLEDRKNKVQRDEFDRYKRALIKNIGAELLDYREILQRSLTLYQKDDEWFDGKYGIKGLGISVSELGYRPDRERTVEIESYLKEKNSPEYRIFNNTTFDQLFKSIEPDLLVQVISAYKQFFQITDTMSYQLSEIRDIDKIEIPQFVSSISISVIPHERLTRFYSTVNSISDRISQIE